MVVVRWYFQPINKLVTEMIKYCDVCQCMNTIELRKSWETLHPITVRLKVWSQIDIDLLCLVKEIDGYKRIVTAVD